MKKPGKNLFRICGRRGMLRRFCKQTKRQTDAIKKQTNDIQNDIIRQTNTINNQTKILCNRIDEIKKEVLKNKHPMECNGFEKIKPSCQSFWIPFVALIILAVLFFIPLHCAAQTTCCCCRDTSRVKQQVTIQFDENVLKLLKGVRCDTTFLKHDVVISPERITVHQQSKLWPLVIFRIACAIILLLGLVFALKYLVPYWTKIAELNDKQRERMMRLEEEQLEFKQLSRRTRIGNKERRVRANIEETAKDGDNKRKIEIMKQEYQSHLADVALDMIKAIHQSKDKDDVTLINQIIQNLKK